MTDLNEHYRKGILRVLGEGAVMGAKFGAYQAAKKIAPGSALTRGLGLSSLRSAERTDLAVIQAAANRGMVLDPAKRRRLLNSVREYRRYAMQEGRDITEYDEALRLLVDL